MKFYTALSVLLAAAAAVVSAATPETFYVKVKTTDKRFNGQCLYKLAPSAHPYGQGAIIQCSKGLKAWYQNGTRLDATFEKELGIPQGFHAPNVPSYPFGEALWVETTVLPNYGTKNITYSEEEGFLSNGMGFLACQWNHIVPQIFALTPAGSDEGTKIPSNCAKVALVKN